MHLARFVSNGAPRPLQCIPGVDSCRGRCRPDSRCWDCLLTGLALITALRWPIATAAGAVLCGVTILAPGQVASAPLQGGVIATGNGTAGIAQSIDVISPSQAGSSVTLGISLGQASQTATVALDRLGVGRVSWTPTASGAWSIGSTGFTSVAATTAAMPTITQLAIPTNPTRMIALPIIATIETGDLLNARPGAQIQGKVIFTEAVRGVIGEAVVRSAQGAVATARLDWVPPGTATFSVTAAFVPTVSQSTGTVSYAASTSEPSAFTVGVDRKRVQLLMPQAVRVGVPTFVAVYVDEDRRGSVSVTVDGRAISPDKPVDGGMVEFLWTPLRKGVADVEVIFHEPGVDDARRSTTSDGVRTDTQRLDLSHVVDQEINVLAQRRPNPISVTPVVDGIAGSPWQNNGVLRYPVGSRVRLVMSTGTGTTVNLEVLGSCLLSGNSLFLPATGGGCVVRFSAPGGPDYSSNEAEVLITVPIGKGTLADTEQNLQGVLKSGLSG